jgi:cell division protein DivIC
VNHRRLILFLYGVVLAGLVVWAGAVFFETRAEYNQLKETEADIRRRLAEAKARLAEQEKILERLKNDPDYVEKVIRRRLHYVKPGETIFWFPD